MTDQGDLGPTVLQMILGAQLRALREARGMTQGAAGKAIRNAASKISRLEAGQTPLIASIRRDLEDLLTLYGVTDPQQRATFLDLADQAREPGWWQSYSDVAPSWLQWYVGLEAGASALRIYAPILIPGLFQTEAYARAVITAGLTGEPAEDLERRVQLRRGRQRRFLDPATAPEVWVVVDETALRRPVGGPEVMRGQLEHLIAMAELPHVRLHIAPLHRNAFPHGEGPFVVLRFADPTLPDIVYLEHLTSAVYLDKRSDIDRYLQTIVWVSGQCEDPADSPAILRRILKEGEANA